MSESDSSEDDIPAIDSESRVALENEVKKGKPRKFILVCKGAQIRSLVVFKKGPYGPRINRTRKSGFRGEFFCGVVDGKGVNLTFQLPGNAAVSEAMKAEGNVYDDAPCEVAKLRKFFSEEAGLKFKPEIRIVTALADVATVNESDDEAPASATAGAATAAAEESSSAASDAGSSPAAAADDALRQKLEEALGKLTPLIKSAVAAAPDRKVELLQKAAEIRDAIKSDRLGEAKTDLVAYGALLKQIVAGGGAAAAAVPAEAADDGSAEYDRRLKALMPNLKTALTTGSPQVGELKAKAEEAQKLRKQGDIQSALRALDELEALLERGRAAQAVDAAVQGQAAAWQKRLSDLTPRYQDAVEAADPDYVKKLRVLYTYATEQAEAQQYAKALAALDRLEPVLTEAETAMEEEEAEGEAEEEELKTGAEDFDAFRKCLSRWNDAVADVKSQLSELRSAALATFPDAAAALDRLDEVFDGLDLKLENELAGGLAAPSAEVRAAIATRVQAIVDKYADAVESNPMIAHADSNPFGVTVNIEETLEEPLAEMEEQLQFV